MKVIVFLCGVLACGASEVAAAASSSGPSFDCTHASTPIDKAICGDGVDTASDRDLAKIYARTMAGLHSETDKRALRDSQRVWIKRRDATCLKPPPPETIGICLRGFYATRLNELDNWGLPALTSTPMADDALTAAYGAGRSDLNFVAAAFSPDAKLFAFTTGVSDTPETVWLYNFSTRKLFAATPVPAHGATATIEQFYWVGQTLYGKGEHAEANAASQGFRFAATTSGSRDVSTLPPAPRTPGEAKDITDANANGGERQEQGAHFSVSSVNNGHGSFSLNVNGSGKEWTLQNGGWELSGFIFDAPHERVLYVGNGGNLVVYQLPSRKKAIYVLPIQHLLAVSPDGTTIAITTLGPCNGPITFPATGPAHICFVKLPK